MAERECPTHRLSYVMRMLKHIALVITEPNEDANGGGHQ